MTALRQCHMPKIMYKLHGSFPDPGFLETETNLLISALLPGLGLNRHTPLAIRHSPEERLGFNLPHILCEAGMIHLKDWLKHVRKDTNTGKQMIINLQWAHLISGL